MKRLHIPKKKFRQINFLVISLVNRYFHKIFAKMRESEFPEFPQCELLHTVWKNEKFTATQIFFRHYQSTLRWIH